MKDQNSVPISNKDRTQIQPHSHKIYLIQLVYVSRNAMIYTQPGTPC